MIYFFVDHILRLGLYDTLFCYNVILTYIWSDNYKKDISFYPIRIVFF